MPPHARVNVIAILELTMRFQLCLLAGIFTLNSFARHYRADINIIPARIDCSRVTQTGPSGVHRAVRTAKHCKTKPGGVCSQVHGR